MTTKQAIDILRQQQAKLDKPNDEIWIIQTASYIKDIFGDKSIEYEAIKHFQFTKRVISIWQTQPDNYEVIRVVDAAKKFLDNCIETVRAKGVHRQSNSNFLQQFDNSIIFAVIIFAIPALLTTGFFFGNLKYDKDKLQLEQRIEQLEDSLIIVKSVIPADSKTNQKRSDTQTTDTITK